MYYKVKEVLYLVTNYVYPRVHHTFWALFVSIRVWRLHGVLITAAAEPSFCGISFKFAVQPPNSTLLDMTLHSQIMGCNICVLRHAFQCTNARTSFKLHCKMNHLYIAACLPVTAFLPPGVAHHRHRLPLSSSYTDSTTKGMLHVGQVFCKCSQFRIQSVWCTCWHFLLRETQMSSSAWKGLEQRSHSVFSSKRSTCPSHFYRVFK